MCLSGLKTNATAHCRDDVDDVDDDDDDDDNSIVFKDTSQTTTASQLALVARQPLVAKHPVAAAANGLTARPVIFLFCFVIFIDFLNRLNSERNSV